MALRNDSVGASLCVSAVIEPNILPLCAALVSFCVARGLGAGMILDAVVSTIDDRKRILSLFCILLRRAERSAISHRYPVSVR